MRVGGVDGHGFLFDDAILLGKKLKEKKKYEMLHFIDFSNTSVGKILEPKPGFEIRDNQKGKFVSLEFSTKGERELWLTRVRQQIQENKEDQGSGFSTKERPPSYFPPTPPTKEHSSSSIPIHLESVQSQFKQKTKNIKERIPRFSQKHFVQKIKSDHFGGRKENATQSTGHMSVAVTGSAVSKETPFQPKPNVPGMKPQLSRNLSTNFPPQVPAKPNFKEIKNSPLLDSPTKPMPRPPASQATSESPKPLPSIPQPGAAPESSPKPEPAPKPAAGAPANRPPSIPPPVTPPSTGGSPSEPVDYKTKWEKEKAKRKNAEARLLEIQKLLELSSIDDIVPHLANKIK